jgi:hypothetical protein
MATTVTELYCSLSEMCLQQRNNFLKFRENVCTVRYGVREKEEMSIGHTIH